MFSNVTFFQISHIFSTNDKYNVIIAVLNVAAGKAPMQSSVADGGIPQKAVDGSTSTRFDLSTCSLTEVEKQPWWYVNLLEPYMVQLVRIDFGQGCCGEYSQSQLSQLIVNATVN